MKIGYYVQGSADRAFIIGLKNRLCPEAVLAEGRFRGESQESFRREITKVLTSFFEGHDCRYVVILTDSDNRGWNEVLKSEFARVPTKYQHKTCYGVADRNIECWLRLDKNHLAKALGCNVAQLEGEDPSDFIKSKFGFRSNEGGLAETKVSDFVESAPLQTWRENSRSFNNFCDQLKEKSTTEGCRIDIDN
jgi:hypothetical protein